ncbi:MAG: Rab family GTPase [Promethearchaeota archaeon]
MSDVREYIFKIVILGDGKVGKTSMVLQYTEHKFNDNYIMSIGANFAIKMIHAKDNTIIRLQLWDLAGQQHFQFVRPSFYRGAFAAIFVFDLTRRESFESIKRWKEECNQYIPGIPAVLVGNKSDLTEERVVSRREGQALSLEIGSDYYYETSAKTATNIEKLFIDVTDTLIEQHITNKRLF